MTMIVQSGNTSLLPPTGHTETGQTGAGVCIADLRCMSVPVQFESTVVLEPSAGEPHCGEDQRKEDEGKEAG